MTGMQMRAILSVMALTGGLVWLGGCPDPEAANDEFNASWCEVSENRLDAPPSNYCTCSTDADCGREDSGKVCAPDGLCAFGCRGLPVGVGGSGGSGGAGGAGGEPEPVFVPSPYGNTCPLGIECSSTDATIGDCGVVCDGPGAGLAAAGTYFMSLAPPVSAKKPAPFLVTITTEQSGPSVLFYMDIQPVAADDRQTLIGSPWPRKGPYELLANGSFLANWGEVSIPGETNPLTDSVLVASFQLVGRFCADQVAEPACGQGLGKITSPITLNVDGTNFYFEPVTAIADHTEPPFLGCDKSVANPL